MTLRFILVELSRLFNSAGQQERRGGGGNTVKGTQATARRGTRQLALGACCSLRNVDPSSTQAHHERFGGRTPKCNEIEMVSPALLLFCCLASCTAARNSACSSRALTGSLVPGYPNCLAHFVAICRLLGRRLLYKQNFKM